LCFFVSPFAGLFGLDVSVGAQGAIFIFTFLMSMRMYDSRDGQNARMQQTTDMFDITPF
jgi:hypothetical protein